MHPHTVPPIYRPRRPWTTALYQVVDRHFETFAAVYDDRFAPVYGPWRPVVRTTAEAYLDCGRYEEVSRGFGAMPAAPSACSPSPAEAEGCALPAPPAPPRSLLPTSSRQSSSPSHTARSYSQFPSLYASTSASTDDYSATSHAPPLAPSPMSSASSPTTQRAPQASSWPCRASIMT